MSEPWAGTTVLVAEDDANALSGYIEFLTAAGFAAAGRMNGADALALALDTPPDIVVTDIMMPQMDGFQLTAALRADRRTRHIPVIGMTAHWTAEMQAQAHRAGLSTMLLKPCMPAHLLAEIERALRHARLLAAALGREPEQVDAAMPVGLRNRMLRRRAAG